MGRPFRRQEVFFDMAKSPKKTERDRSKKEAQALFDHTVKRMLSTPPRPHEPLKKQQTAKRATAKN
jgi:hypothetical protein